jgi:hypothetical protein
LISPVIKLLLGVCLSRYLFHSITPFWANKKARACLARAEYHFYRSTRTKTKPSSYMALILWCKAVKHRGTTKSHAQLLSQLLTSIFEELISFTFLLFCL